MPSPATTIRFSPPADVWSTNADRTMHWSKRARLVKAWRMAAHMYARQAGAFPPSLVTVSLPFTRNGRRDPMNYVGTVVKAIVDGLVDAGCWPDDTAEYVEIRQPVLAVGTTDVVVTITPLP